MDRRWERTRLCSCSNMRVLVESASLTCLRTACSPRGWELISLVWRMEVLVALLSFQQIAGTLSLRDATAVTFLFCGTLSLTDAVAVANLFVALVAIHRWLFAFFQASLTVSLLSCDQLKSCSVKPGFLGHRALLHLTVTAFLWLPEGQGLTCWEPQQVTYVDSQEA